eukprot:TRINITY_DN23892_c0_g1_i1.p1 TRINITY_DN23892_c0_g1~~TRINITY_DN23892_c0_g1_i1.p1  ORF type:complete len:562 (-),score=79.92 TRINITY_DN23892_c0_g1_i1:138-1790(-)
MSFLAVAPSSNADTSDTIVIEEAAFWLLSLLLEDVLDPDFFGADVQGNLQMAFIGGLGLRGLVLDLAEVHCPLLLDALGHEAFVGSLGAVLDQWVLSLFVGCMPDRLLEHFWDHLVLPSPYHPIGFKGLPRGLATVVAFALAALRCCGEERIPTSTLRQLRYRRVQEGASPEELSLEAAEVVQGIRMSFLRWPAAEDGEFLGSFTRIVVSLAEEGRDLERLWESLRKRKQRIADCAGDYDEQLLVLARRTHFSVQEMGRLRLDFQKHGGLKDGLDLDTFRKLVHRSVPEFPPELCRQLFHKLDAFEVGRLSFVELACGMSALSLGTMEEKLQVCFDLFDSGGHKALTLKDLCELCTVLFRVALSQGFEGTRRARTDEDLDSAQLRRPPMSPMMVPLMQPRATTPAGGQWLLAASEPMTELLAADAAAGAPVRRSGSPDRAVGRGAAPAWQDQPWRSMLLRLLAAARIRTPGGPWLVHFEDFRRAAQVEPALLCLFSWCLPRPPALCGPAFLESADSESMEPDRQRGIFAFLYRLCSVRQLCCWLSGRQLA